MSRRAAAAGVSAVALVVVLAIAVATTLRAGDGSRAADAAPVAAGHWVELPRPPLSPRTSGLGVWTGTEALLVGGVTGRHCPPSAGCTEPEVVAKDGAALDPGAGTWRRIAAAPVAVGAWTPHALAGRLLVVVGDDGTWHAYDVPHDSWSDLPEPPRPASLHAASISASGGRVVALATSGQVMALDLARRTWTTLPASPHPPRLDLHHAVATPEGIVAVGVDSTEPDDGSEPSYLLAEVHRDGAWDRLPPSDMVGGYSWHWTGERLVAPTTTCVDGGEVDGYGRCVPEGGVLDPGRRAWGPLPTLLDVTGSGWRLSGAYGSRILVGSVLYDDADGSAVDVGSPRGARRYADTTSVAADAGVIAFGGIDWSSRRREGGELTARAWRWTPGQ